MASSRTPTWRLADLDVPGGLDEFVSARRRQEPPAGWRTIAVDIALATNGRVRLSHEALRSWYGGAVEAAA